MRIAVWHDLPGGGARRALQEITRRLAAKHTVHSYLIDPPPSNYNLMGQDGDSVTLVPYRPRAFNRHLLFWNDWLAYRNSLDLSALEQRLAERIDGDGYDVVLVSTLRGALAPDITR